MEARGFDIDLFLMWKADKNLCFNFYAYLARIKNGLKSVQAKNWDNYEYRVEHQKTNTMKSRQIVLARINDIGANEKRTFVKMRSFG
jgi:hypothetical protein